MLACSFTGVGAYALFSGTLAGEEFVKLAGAVMFFYGAADVGQDYVHLNAAKKEAGTSPANSTQEG